MIATREGLNAHVPNVLRLAVRCWAQQSLRQHKICVLLVFLFFLNAIWTLRTSFCEGDSWSMH